MAILLCFYYFLRALKTLCKFYSFYDRKLWRKAHFLRPISSSYGKNSALCLYFKFSFIYSESHFWVFSRWPQISDKKCGRDFIAVEQLVFHRGAAAFDGKQGSRRPLCVVVLSCAWCVDIMCLTCAHTSVVRLMPEQKKSQLRCSSAFPVLIIFPFKFMTPNPQQLLH